MPTRAYENMHPDATTEEMQTVYNSRNMAKGRVYKKASEIVQLVLDGGPKGLDDAFKRMEKLPQGIAWATALMVGDSLVQMGERSLLVAVAKAWAETAPEQD